MRQLMSGKSILMWAERANKALQQNRGYGFLALKTSWLRSAEGSRSHVE
jgi:hypothetical protein